MMSINIMKTFLTILFLPFHSRLVYASSLCLDNLDYYYLADWFTCKFIRSDEERRLNRCQIKEISINCPITCGVCCKNDWTFTFPNPRNSTESVNCWWLNHGVLIDRAEVYCDTSYGGSQISDRCPLACDECQSFVSTSPTQTPTMYPTKTSSPSSSSAPSQFCINDCNYYHNDEYKTCDWIGKYEDRRTRLCQINAVRDSCPITCGICCEDDARFRFEGQDGAIHQCTWIDSSWKRGKYCDGSIESGRIIRDACPVSCNNCKSFVTKSKKQRNILSSSG